MHVTDIFYQVVASNYIITTLNIVQSTLFKKVCKNRNQRLIQGRTKEVAYREFEFYRKTNSMYSGLANSLNPTLHLVFLFIMFRFRFMRLGPSRRNHSWGPWRTLLCIFCRLKKASSNLTTPVNATWIIVIDILIRITSSSLEIPLCWISYYYFILSRCI